MVVDHEAAWIELQALIASKPQHGREPTLAAMAEIAARHRVPAGELSRLLRLYGVEVERARSISTEIEREEPELSGGDSLPVGMAAHRASSTVGGHDVSSNGSARGGAG